MITTLFFGTPQFAAPTLQALLDSPHVRVAAVITQPDRPSGRGAVMTPPPVKLLAEQRGIPVFQPLSIRKEFSTLRESLKALGPIDIGVVVAFGQILPVEVLEYPSHGCINIHASLLPRWRGAAPIQRAIEAGDSETGVCLMKMDAGLDTGAVFSRATTHITEDDTAQTLQDRLSGIGAELLLKDLDAIMAGVLHPVPQPTEGVTYAKKITSAESSIVWTRSAAHLANQIRAFNPHPGSHTTWQGRRLKILCARETTLVSPESHPPGTVVKASSEDILIQCGMGVLRVEELQLEGKKRMTTAEFMRGATLSSGTRLGDHTTDGPSNAP